MERNNISFKMMRVHQLKRWQTDTLLSKEGHLYFGQLPILGYILKNPGCKQKEIADSFALSRATITKSVKRLLKADIIKRDVNEEDERKFMLYLTDKGQQLTGRAFEIFKKIDQQTYKGFSNDDLAKFNHYLDMMLSNLETDYSRGKSPLQLGHDIKSIEKANYIKINSFS